MNDFLGDGDLRVFVRGRFVGSVTIAKGHANLSVAPSADWPFNQVSAKLTYFVVAIFEDYLTRSSQFVGSVPLV